MMIEFSFLAFYPQFSSVSSGFADLKETVYGLQLLSLLRLYGFSRYMKLIIHDDPELRDKRIRILKKLKTAKVKVGLPASAGGRLQLILAVQEHGSPVMRIPARPVIRPALSRPETRQAMAEEMGNALRAAWDGEDPRPDLEAAGQAGADGIRAYIDAGISPPNSPVTVSGGWIWNRPGHKAVYVACKGMNNPLFDTGALYNAFSYEIDE